MADNGGKRKRVPTTAGGAGAVATPKRAPSPRGERLDRFLTDGGLKRAPRRGSLPAAINTLNACKADAHMHPGVFQRSGTLTINKDGKVKAMVAIGSDAAPAPGHICLCIPCEFVDDYLDEVPNDNRWRAAAAAGLQLESETYESGNRVNARRAAKLARGAEVPWAEPLESDAPLPAPKRQKATPAGAVTAAVDAVGAATAQGAAPQGSAGELFYQVTGNGFHTVVSAPPPPKRARIDASPAAQEKLLAAGGQHVANALLKTLTTTALGMQAAATQALLPPGQQDYTAQLQRNEAAQLRALGVQRVQHGRCGTVARMHTGRCECSCDAASARGGG